VPEQALHLLQGLRASAVSTDDVVPGVTARALSHHPIVLYSQYLSIAGREAPLPPFVHFSGEGIDESVSRYCAGPDWDESSVDACIDTLAARVAQDEGLRARHNNSIEATLEVCRTWRLPPNTDLAEVAAQAADLQACPTPARRGAWRQALHHALVASALPPLLSLARDAGADMGDGPLGHSYDLLFAPLYDSVRTAPLRMLEIGLGGGASIQTWRRYFPAASVHTVEVLLRANDCDPCRLDGVAGGVLGWGGDSSDVGFLERVASGASGRFDLIVDDGGHVPRVQLTTWAFLFVRALRPGGRYFLLDVETSFWNAPHAALYGTPVAAGRGSGASAVEAFKALVDGVSRPSFLFSVAS
jgi:hypothetical protein